MGHVFSGGSKKTTEDITKPNNDEESNPEEKSKEPAVATGDKDKTPEPQQKSHDFKVGDAVTYCHSPKGKEQQVYRIHSVDKEQLTTKIVNEVEGGTVEGCSMDFIKPVPSSEAKEEGESSEKVDAAKDESAATQESAEGERADETLPQPSVSGEKPPSEGKASVSEEKPLSEEKPCVSEEKPLSDEKPSVSEEMPLSEEKPSVSEEKPLSDEKPSVAEEKPEMMAVENPNTRETTPPTLQQKKNPLKSPGGGLESQEGSNGPEDTLKPELTTKEHLETMERNMEELNDLHANSSNQSQRKRLGNFQDCSNSEKRRKTSTV